MKFKEMIILDTINVIYVEPGKNARSIEIKDELEEMQKLVGGLIEEYMPFEDDVALICNDEGKMLGMPLNRGITNDEGQLMDIIAGPFFIAYAPIESEKFLSLPEELKKKYTEKFRQPEIFVKTSEGIKAVKYEPNEPSVEAR